jgi:hypothetical protein
VYQAKNTDGVVLLTTDTLRYGSAPHAGEHGGASLAEVVAPCLLLGWDDPISETGPTDARLAPVFVPDWWHYATPSAALPPAELAAPPPASRRKKPVSDQQLGLPGVTPPPATASPAPQDPFLECEMLKARASTPAERQRVTRAVRFLLGRGDVAPLDAFAQHLGVPIFRAEGIVALLTETLNVDGYEVLRFDRERRQLFLDKQKLQVQFEVRL